MSPELLASLGAVVTATLTGIGGILATRSSHKIDELEDLRDELSAARTDLDAAVERHGRETTALRFRIAELEGQLAEKNRAITKLDRVVMALRQYVARARRTLIDHEIDLPPEVDGMNE